MYSNFPPKQVISMFKGCKAEDMPPHIYAAAQKAYRHMLSARTDQSLVLMGRSGGGKSTSVRHLMHYFTVAAGAINNLLNGWYCIGRGIEGPTSRWFLWVAAAAERAPVSGT